jgi:hypothetical protein
MKTLTLAILALTVSFNTFAKCNTTLEIKLFSERFADAKQFDNYSKIVRKLKISGLKTVDAGASFSTIIEAGVEKGMGDGKDTLLSHITVLNRKGEVVFEDYKNRKVSENKNIQTSEILNFVAKHVRQEYPTCGI